MKRARGGFTLIELVVALAASALVLLVAASLMLLGLRVQNRAGHMVSEQQTVDIVFDIVAELAEGGDIKSAVKSSGSWALYDKEGDLLLEYDAGEESIAMGGSVLLADVKSADVRVEGRLFTLTVETHRESYETTVYCRVGTVNEIIAG